MSHIPGYCNSFFVALLLLVVTSSADAQGQPNNAGSQQPTLANGSAQDNTRQDPTSVRAQTIQRIARELDELIPGVYPPSSPNRNLLLEIATSYYDGKAKEFNEALERLEKSEPNLPPKGLLMAGVNYTVNRVQDGLRMLERAAIDSPNHPSISLAFCRLAISQGRLMDARALVEMTERMIASSPLPAVALDAYRLQLVESQVTVAMQQQRFDDALRFAIQWEKAAPQNGTMFIKRAEIEFQKGNIVSSQEYIGRFRAVTPESRPTELILAKWFQQKGDGAGTEEWVKKAAVAYPKNSLVQLEFANWAVSQEDFATAMTAVGQLESKNGETPETKLIKGRIAFANGTYGVAETHFAELYQEQSSNFDVSNMYALCLIESKDPDKQMKARQIAQRNLQGLPNSQVARAAFGWVLLKMGNMGDAKQVLNQAAQSFRLPPEIAYFMAVRFQQEGKSDTAKTLLEAALKQKGMFLYRKKATAMLEEIVGTAFLPDPKK